MCFPLFFHFVPEMPTFEISRNDTKTQFQLKVTGATPPIPPTRLFDAYRVSLPLPYHFCLVKLTEMRISFVTTAVCRPEVISCIMAVFCRTAHIKKKKHFRFSAEGGTLYGLSRYSSMLDHIAHLQSVN